MFSSPLQKFDLRDSFAILGLIYLIRLTSLSADVVIKSMTKLSITCGSQSGELHVRLDEEDDGPKKAYVLDGAGNQYTPAVFETYAGYRTKKWKWSFFVHEEGYPPKRFCEWVTDRRTRKRVEEVGDKVSDEAGDEAGDEEFGMRFVVVCPKCGRESASLANPDWFFECPIAECAHVFHKEL